MEDIVELVLDWEREMEMDNIDWVDEDITSVLLNCIEGLADEDIDLVSTAIEREGIHLFDDQFLSSLCPFEYSHQSEVFWFRAVTEPKCWNLAEQLVNKGGSRSRDVLRPQL